MALNPHWGLTAREGGLDSAMNLANGGTFVLYNGTQPANADTAVTTQVALVTWTLPNPAFGAATGSAGASATKTLNAVTAVSAVAGVATWGRIYKSDGTTGVWDGSVGTSSADIIVANTTITLGELMSISSLVITFSA